MAYLIVRDGEVTQLEDLPDEIYDDVASDDVIVVRKKGGGYEYMDSEKGWCDVEEDEHYAD